MMKSVLLSCLILVLCVQVCSAALFTALPSGPWAPRIRQGWAWPTTTISYVNSTTGAAQQATPGSTVLAWGGNTFTDVFISTDSAQSWTLIAGMGGYQYPNGTVYYVSTAFPTTFQSDDSGDCKAYDPIKREFYQIDATGTYFSNNAITWQLTSNSEYAGRQSSTCAVDPANRLYILGGQNITTGSSAYENDIWVSTNQGSTFTQNPTAPWSQRDSQTAFAAQQPLGKSVLYALGGHAEVENVRPSDMWVSSDAAQSWTLLGRAPWQGRDHFTSLVTSNNIIVVLGGKVDPENSAGNHLGYNDVWASLDGGATWGACSLAAEFPVRQDHTLSIDSAGYLYVTGGTSNPATGPQKVNLNDVWRSTISFTNVAAVQSQCGVTAPTCGMGLRCWPNPTTYVSGNIAGTVYPIATPANYSCPCSSNTAVSVVMSNFSIVLLALFMIIAMLSM